jgi:hypothetical protein
MMKGGPNVRNHVHAPVGVERGGKIALSGQHVADPARRRGPGRVASRRCRGWTWRLAARSLPRPRTDGGR